MTDNAMEQEAPKGQERELAELKREVIESRNLIIKTDNLLKNLQVELKNVAKKGADQYSRTWLATGAAYAIFAVLAVAIGILASRLAVSVERGRIEQAESARVEAQKQAIEAKTALESEKQEAALRQSASGQAMAVFRQLTDARMETRLKGLEASLKIDPARLSALEKAALDDRSRQLRDEASTAALEKAKSSYRRQDMKAAVDSFDRYFSFSPEGREASNARFLAGAANFELKAFAQAAQHLERFVAGGKAQKNHDYGTALLGQALEKMGEGEKALRVYEKGLADYPSNSVMKNRANALRRGNAGAAPAAATAAATPASPPPAAQPPQPPAQAQQPPAAVPAR